jgi:L-threonylcarbamoyladenylate synthase
MTKLRQIISAINNGSLLCLPTDTLYSLSCDATNDNSVKKIFQVKGRDFNKPLPIFVYNLAHAQQYGFFNNKALILAEKFWPGQLTMILPRKNNSNLSQYVYGVNPNIAIRVPQHKLLLQILKEAQLPLVATSANKSDTPNKLTLDEVKIEFNDQINLYIPNGFQDLDLKIRAECLKCTKTYMKTRSSEIFKNQILKGEGYIENNEPIQINKPSTIIDCCSENPIISRQGQIAMKDIMHFLDK